MGSSGSFSEGRSIYSTVYMECALLVLRVYSTIIHGDLLLCGLIVSTGESDNGKPLFLATRHHVICELFSGRGFSGCVGGRFEAAEAPAHQLPRAFSST